METSHGGGNELLQSNEVWELVEPPLELLLTVYVKNTFNALSNTLCSKI